MLVVEGLLDFNLDHDSKHSFVAYLHLQKWSPKAVPKFFDFSWLLMKNFTNSIEAFWISFFAFLINVQQCV